jgi:hypothetical protein
VTELKARVTSVTTWNCIYKLRRAAELLNPSIDISWLAEIESELALVMVPRSKFDRLVLTGRIVEAGLTLIVEADKYAKSKFERAKGIRNGLMIAILALCQIRRSVLAASDDQIEQQRHMEYVCRFLVHTYIPYNVKLDVEEFADDGIVTLAAAGETRQTFECIVVGIGKNIDNVLGKPNPTEFVQQRIARLWRNPAVEQFFGAGLRGTVRIQRTVPFGARWFAQ